MNKPEQFTDAYTVEGPIWAFFCERIAKQMKEEFEKDGGKVVTAVVVDIDTESHTITFA